MPVTLQQIAEAAGVSRGDRRPGAERQRKSPSRSGRENKANSKRDGISAQPCRKSTCPGEKKSEDRDHPCSTPRPHSWYKSMRG